MSFILIFGASSIILVKELVSLHLERELKEKGLSISRNLAETCIEPMLVEEIVKLQKLIQETKRLEKDIVYIFIVDNQNNVIVHTFGDFFPEGLKDINRLRPDEPYQIQILKTEDELIQNIAWPILGGSLGEVCVGMSYRSRQQVVFSIMYKLVGIMSIVMLGCGALFYFFTMKALYPLKIITKAIKEIGGGNLEQRIQIKSEDEIGYLAYTFNEMAEKLEKANTELKSTQNKLIQTAKLATVGQFAAGIAHEINNPLAGILNCIRTLLADPTTKGERRGYMELSLKGLLRIENIIRKILSSSAHYDFKVDLTNINKTIDESLSFFSHRAISQKVSIQKNYDPAIPNILVDENQLQQVFTNIITNSLDAMLEGGSLNIKTCSNKENIEIEFIDTGCGIRADYLEKVFEPFFTTKDVGKGVGLGLFISYNIIKQHNGTISIKSKEGEGTTVTITLPI